jgi:hypothetical protein
MGKGAYAARWAAGGLVPYQHRQIRQSQLARAARL